MTPGGYVVIARSPAGTLWVAGPNADNRISEDEAKRLAESLRKSAPKDAYRVEYVEANKSAIEGKQ